MSKLLQAGFEHHKAGRLVDAEQAYRIFLKRDPRHSDGWHLLGVVCYQLKRYDEALDFISKAIRLNSNQSLYYCHLGNVLNAQGHRHEALLHYQNALQLDSTSLETLERLALLYCQLMRFDEAESCYERAVVLAPNSVFLCSGVGDLRRLQGRLEEAVNVYIKALTLDPNHTPALINLGATFEALGRLDLATPIFQRVQAIAPLLPEPFYNLGNVYMAQGRLAEAQVQFREAIERRPNYADAHNNLGTIHYLQNQTDEAMLSYRQALFFKQDFADARVNLGNTLRANGMLEEALVQYGHALAIDSELPEAHLNMGMVELLQGRYEEGWQSYEWRTRVKSAARPAFSQPQWSAESLRGKRILLYSEQGLGDTLQFLRFVHTLSEAGSEIVLQVQSRLKRIAANLPGVIGVVGPGEGLPDFDFHFPLMSLPSACGITLQNLPVTVPYLVIPDEASEKASHLDWSSPLLKVGIAWEGGLREARDQVRSIPFADLAPLFEQRDVQFYSLQLQGLSEELRRDRSWSLVELSSQVTDMADTAAQIEHLDLVITVDTSIAHLAGALGKPVWVVLPANADWRWLLEREDSPWYPSARLFRQNTRGEWSGVISRVKDALQDLATTFLKGSNVYKGQDGLQFGRV